MAFGRKKKVLDLTMNKSAKKIIAKNIRLRAKNKKKKGKFNLKEVQKKVKLK